MASLKRRNEERLDRQVAIRLFVDEDPDLVVDAPWLVDLGQQTRRARSKSCLRRPPRAWRRRSKPWVLSPLYGAKSDNVLAFALAFDLASDRASGPLPTWRPALASGLATSTWYPLG